MPVILATWEAEIRRIKGLEVSPGKKVIEIPSGHGSMYPSSLLHRKYKYDHRGPRHKHDILSQKLPKPKRAGGITQMVQHLTIPKINE
jgi:hypothetical protein